MEFSEKMRVVMVVVMGVVSVARAECEAPGNGTVAWRTRRDTLRVQLNDTHIACVEGAKCLNTTHESDPLSLVMQSEDEISLEVWVAADGDNASYEALSVGPGSEDRCDFGSEETSLASSDSPLLTLTPGSLPAPGLWDVVVRRRSDECSLSWRLQIRVHGHECARSGERRLCSGKGFCDNFSDAGSFSCRCCPGYVGKYCEERDGCYGNPCRHGGFCVDIAEGLSGTTFQCLCPHGYRGRACEEEVSRCDRRPCLNNGTCHGNRTSYRCECAEGFRGADCETNVNECLSNPCVHGVCEDGPGAYKCYCLPGYGGEHCEFEYDECDSSPCINGGACEDLVAGYRCHCGPGYRGRRCQVKVDLCSPNPCPAPAQCVDRGNNYSCFCHPGFNGPGCTQRYDPCYPNPCQNGGSCWPSLDSYFCSCRPGFTGDLCEEVLPVSRPMPRTLDPPTGEPGSDPWHTLYLVGTMLTLVATGVALVAVLCHFRLHGACLARVARRLRGRAEDPAHPQPLEDPGKFSLNLRGSASEATGPATYEATSVDGLDAPLIC